MRSFIRKLIWRLSRKTVSQYKPVILVTGCSSGIGLAIADELYDCEQYQVIITARAHSIPDLASRFLETDRFMLRALDVADSRQRENLIAEITERFGGVDILINNAGICYRAALEDMTELDERRQMATNYFAPIELIRLVLPQMRNKGRGKIINVSSVSGMLAMPTMASYSASKHALEGACEALWYETRPFGITVSLVQPGFVRSKSFERVRHTKASQEALLEEGVYSDFYSNMAPFIAKLMNLSFATPESIAKLIVRVIRTENPPLWIPATIDAQIFALLRKLVPQRVLLPLLFMALPNSKTWARKITRSRKIKVPIQQEAV